jgi:hypothetical protein
MTEQPQPPADTANDPSLIRVCEKSGRQLFVTKDNVANRRAAGNDPFELGQSRHNVIVAALNDGFRADILKAAEQI